MMCALSWNSVVSEKTNLLFLTIENFCVLKSSMVLEVIMESSISFRFCEFGFETLIPHPVFVFLLLHPSRILYTFATPYAAEIFSRCCSLSMGGL
jgi:hypothetical protein